MLCPDEMGILPLTNEWPESLMMADRSHIIMPSSSNSSTTSSPDTAARHPTGPHKCPRCDSTNTKFCYYNNYSLAQPRHFCKACKRYWTRGGTLRNVPVGGGCRKNKRIKKTATYTDSSTLTLPPPPISSNANFSNTADINPNFFYNLSDTISYPNLQQRVQEYYDLQPQTKASLGLGLGFGFGFTPTNEDQYPHHFRANLTDSTAVSSAVKDYHYPLFGSSSATAASLLVSSLKQQRKIDDYQSLMNYNDQQLNGSLGLLFNQVKVEGEANNSFDWQLSCEAPFDATSAAATSAQVDSSFMYWNGAASSSWPEANYGSSITPLI